MKRQIGASYFLDAGSEPLMNPGRMHGNYQRLYDVAELPFAELERRVRQRLAYEALPGSMKDDLGSDAIVRTFDRATVSDDDSRVDENAGNEEGVIHLTIETFPGENVTKQPKGAPLLMYHHQLGEDRRNQVAAVDVPWANFILREAQTDPRNRHLPQRMNDRPLLNEHPILDPNPAKMPFRFAGFAGHNKEIVPIGRTETNLPFNFQSFVIRSTSSFEAPNYWGAFRSGERLYMGVFPVDLTRTPSVIFGGYVGNGTSSAFPVYNYPDGDVLPGKGAMNPLQIQFYTESDRVNDWMWEFLDDAECRRLQDQLVSPVGLVRAGQEFDRTLSPGFFDGDFKDIEALTDMQYVIRQARNGTCIARAQFGQSSTSLAEEENRKMALFSRKHALSLERVHILAV